MEASWNYLSLVSAQLGRTDHVRYVLQLKTQVIFPRTFILRPMKKNRAVIIFNYFTYRFNSKFKVINMCYLFLHPGWDTLHLEMKYAFPKKKDDGDDALWSAASKGYLCMWYVRENLRGMKEEFYASMFCEFNDDIRMITDIK